MKIKVLAVGGKMPAWVEAGVAEYCKRLPVEFELSFREIPLARRHKGYSVEQCVEKEAKAMLALINRDDHVIALEVKGKSYNTSDLAARVQELREQARAVSLLVGGPDGLSRQCLERANEQWSLSKLTLPHPLVRIVLAEQLYRVWSLLNQHPYHRE